MPFSFSLRNKLMVIFIATIILPFLTLAIILPTYFKGLISEETQNVTSGAMNSLSRNIETYLDDLDRLTLLPYYNDELIQALKITAYQSESSLDDYTKLKTYRALNGTLPSYLLNTRKEIINTVMITRDGKGYLSSKFEANKLVQGFPYQEQSWYQKAVEADGKAAFIGSHKQDYLSDTMNRRVFSVARLIKDPDSKQPISVIIADADYGALNKIIDDIAFSSRSMIVIMDESGEPVYSNKEVPISLKSQLKNHQKITIGDQKYVSLTKNLTSADWQIIVLLSESEMNGKIRWISNVAVIVSAGGIAITFILFMYLTRWIVTPFKRIIEVMKQARTGNLQARFTSVGKDEISLLGQSLNKMIYQLDDMINREYKTALSLKKAEYQALQSQIQPHFLYNVLTGFIGLNQTGEKRKLEDAIFALSGMLRYILADNQNTTIAQEFQILQGYGLLQKLRFDEKLQLDIHFEKSVGSFSIPKLLIQPIVENAIIHGVEPSESPCLVEVKAFIYVDEEGEYIRIKVRDTGVGFQLEAAPSAGQHLGIANVKTRLEMLYDEAEFRIESSPGSGTSVYITIPLKGAQL
ncbi:cache domain-containing sensor histidine kinase [Paenibacillus radicis (ex Gao et al. 2016)]|uniref:histidine kinase n=1 Tax=Paenibacillus radicis (ex Gao et al. 2016) TaxID=1737354 RepID=A0A917LV74_9BACL|nr:sensor histidine kinase [Paenibacillus radicis (ex Gao et al. 2016)]GGG59558.1 histidine kinase [Paenibacillus radicis (ex Gao et al. 2016)]